MISIDKLVEIGFTVSQATDLSLYFRNMGYLTVGQQSVVSGYQVPSNKVVVIGSNETLSQVFKADSQEYADISTILAQKGNMNPNKSRVNNVIVYFATQNSGETLGDLVQEFVSVNANWTQLVINSKEATAIEKVADKCVEVDRLFVAQTNDNNVANKIEDNVALKLSAKSNANTYLLYHGLATESLAGGVASIMANQYLGGVGSLYSTVTNVTPQNYTDTINTNLDDQNVSYYSTVNAINGGGVEMYGSPIVYGGKMINGENAKRRYIRYYLDKVLKARSIDFLKKKLGYEATSSDILESMLKAVLITAQTNDLISEDDFVDNTVVKGFELKVLTPAEIRVQDETAYNNKTYLVQGYYRDSLTGEKVNISLYIDPTEAEKTVLGF